MFKKYTKINRPLKSIEDIDLLKSLKSENKEDLKLAQEEFFYRYRNYIYVVSLDRAKHFNKGAEMAEDMAQETLIKAFRNIHNLKLKEDTSKANNIIKKWLSVTIRNEFVTFFRKNNDESNLSYNLDFLPESQLSDLKTEKNEPDIHLTQLNLALQELSDIEKHVILTYFDYYDWQNPRKHLPDRVLKELRDTYSTTSDNLKHIKFRAMKKLRKILEK